MDIVKAVATKTGYTQKAIKEILGYLEEAVCEGLSAGEKVKFAGVTVEVRDVAARTGRNIATGELQDYPATKTAKAKTSKALKDAAKSSK